MGKSRGDRLPQPGIPPGGVVEWLMAPVLKTGEAKASVGSNPTPSVHGSPRPPEPIRVGDDSGADGIHPRIPLRRGSPMAFLPGHDTYLSGPPSRAYRLIDSSCQPHPQLDGHYTSPDEAWIEAVGWLESLGPAAGNCWIGMEVSTASGDWRTIRLPDLLLCPLPCG